MKALHRTLLPFLAITLLVTAANAKITRYQDETIDLDGIKSVEVKISAGNIDIVGSNRSDLQFDLKKTFKTNSESEADEIEENITQSIKRNGDSLVIEIKYESKSSWLWNVFSNGNNVHFEAELVLPDDIFAIAHTNGGNIETKNMTNRIDVKTNGGNIKIAQSSGQAKAHTNGGNIRAEGLSGNADLHTNGGNIHLYASNATIAAHTNGGNISADFNNGIASYSKLSTNGGSITARLPNNYGFELLAQANGGHIRLNYEGDIQGLVENKKINAKVNEGGPKLHLSTTGGSVTIANL